MNPTRLVTLIPMMVCVANAAPVLAQSPARDAPSRVRPALPLPELEPAPAARQTSSATRPLVWKDEWAGIRGWEYPSALVLMAGGFSARFLVRPPPPNWVGTSDFEQSVLDRLAVRSNPANENIRKASDLSFYGAMAYRLFDSAILPGLLHEDSWDVAWKMSWIDFESLAVVAAVEWGTQIFVARVRPTGVNCTDPRREGHLCDTENADYAGSFIAGHTATASAVAGLTCLHHGHLPLYGGGLADDIACGVMVLNAVGNGFARVASELHYPSDMLLGLGLGIAAGWVFPRVLHYGWGEPDPVETVGLPESVDAPPALIFSVSPTIFDTRPGLTVVGSF